jgi:hypothetical protein
MTLRADHVAGAAFVLLGGFVLALSGDLPIGGLSMPGSGFMPSLVAAILILLGLVLVVRGRESDPLSAIEWSDAKHAGLIVVITAAATLLYIRLGFILTMGLLMAALLLIVERRRPLRAGVYSACVVLAAYAVFKWALRAPLPAGPLGF